MTSWQWYIRSLIFKSEAFILQSKYLCLHSTSGRWSPAADWYSRSLWACCYCCRLGSKLKLWLLIPTPLLLPPPVPPCPLWSTPLQGEFTPSATPKITSCLTVCAVLNCLNWLCTPKHYHIPSPSGWESTILTGCSTVSHNFRYFRLKDTPKNQNYLLGPQGCQKESKEYWGTWI